MSIDLKRAGRLALSLACLVVVCGCQSPMSLGGEQAAGGKRITVIDDIPYRSNIETCRLDLAVPENFGGDRRPAIVIVHGGGWRAGSKQDRPYRSMLVDYALKGYVTISIDYRLLNEAPFPACIDDVRCAVRWLRAHAEEYGADPDRIGVYGHSAGAHLAILLGLCPLTAAASADDEWAEYSDAVTAAAGGSTPAVLPDRFGDTDKYSPMNYVSSDALPILLIHGTDDNICPVESTDAFVEKLKEVGAENVTYIRIDGGNHGVAYEHFLDRSDAAMVEFFDRTLRGRK
jgi:acetyl esterase/lipase